MNWQTLKYELSDDGIATLTFNRPESLNALNSMMMQETLEAVTQISQDSRVRVAILTGAGRAFIAGADLKGKEDRTMESFNKHILDNQRLAFEMLNCPKPLIAAVNGWALGGGLEIALDCDMVIASETAKFGFPEVNVGLFHTTGITYLLPRMIGIKRTMDIILTGRFFEAQEAREMGLVNKVVKPDELIPHTKEIALDIIQKSPVAIRWAKRAFQVGATIDLFGALSMETEGVTSCYLSEDRIEGLRAFKEKRKPEFKGR